MDDDCLSLMLYSMGPSCDLKLSCKAGACSAGWPNFVVFTEDSLLVLDGTTLNDYFNNC